MFLRDLQRLVGRVLQREPNPAVLPGVQPLDRELLLKPRHDYVAVFSLGHPVHDEQLARVDARLHRIALDAHVEGRERVLDEVAVGVDAAGDLVLSGTREARRDTAFDEGARQPDAAPRQVDSDNLQAPTSLRIHVPCRT